MTMKFLQGLPKTVKAGIGSAACLVFGLIFGWAAFPKILKSQLSKEMSLSKGNDLREMWTTIPFALDFKLYLFNCTNPDEVMKGSKPIVQEIGPYFYEEWKEKVNMVDVEEEDAIYYNTRDTFIFKQDKSGPGLTGDEIIVIPHIIIVSTAVTVLIEKPSMMALAGKAINGIYDNPSTVFMAYKAKDILFDGIVINCDRTDFAPKAVCTAMKKEGRNLEYFGNNQFKFSFFGKQNGTISVPKYKVFRGKKNVMDVGKVIEYDGEPSQSIWNGPECNDFVGTDATVFPPFLTEKDQLLSFTPEICRSIGALYERKSAYSGIRTNRYVADLGDLANEPQNQCFCDGPDKCPAKGLMDLYKCLKAPFTASMPHFLKADPKVQDTVKGLRPNLEDHGIYIDFEPISGTPLLAKKRLQFNLWLPKIDKLEQFKNLPNTLIPVLWAEEGLAMNKTYVNMLKHQLFIPLRIVGVIKWMMVSGGIIGIIVSAILHHKTDLFKFVINSKGNRTMPDTRLNTQSLNAVESKEKTGGIQGNIQTSEAERF